MVRPEGSRFDLIVAALSGVAAVALVLGVLAVEQLQITHEVQLWAPSHAREGDSVPVRALVFTALDAPEGPTLVQERVSASLEAARAPAPRGLSPATLGSLEGELVAERGAAEIVVRVEGSAGELLATASQPLSLGEVPPLPLRGRLGDALQHLSLARPPALEAALPELDVRVEGGVCVPEQTCRVWFWRGASEVVPRLLECTTMDIAQTHVGQALVSIDVVVHGAEARCHVLLEPLGLETELQLPVGLATPWLEVREEGGALRVRAEPPIGRDAVLLDVFVDHRWLLARTLERGEELELAPSSLGSGSGIARLQARLDVTSSERAYQRAVPLGDAGVEEASLEALLGVRGTTGEEARRWARLALDADLIDVVAPVSGVALDQERVAALRAKMRALGVTGVLLAVLAILGAITRRGLASAKEARSVMVEAGLAGADDARARRRSWLVVVGYVAAVGLAILLGAAFLAARPFFLG